MFDLDIFRSVLVTSSRSLVDPNSQNPTSREVDLRIASRPTFIPRTIPCSLHSEDLSLIRVQYKVSLEYELELLGSSDWACAPTLDHFYLYTKALRARLCLLIPPFVIALFQFLNIFFASMIPNSFKFIIGFLSLCISIEVHSTISLFRNYFTFKHHLTTKDRWYLSSQFDKKRLLKDAPSSIHNWKEQFFFVLCPSLELGFPPWGS